ncbi:hypothetical protein ACS4RR_021080 [Rhizobium sp. Z1P35]
MGKSIPDKVDPYVPRTSILIREHLTTLILQRIDALGISAAEVAKYYGTFRKGYIEMMRDGVVFGEKRLFSMCEALEIFPVISLAKNRRDQYRLMEAA